MGGITYSSQAQLEFNKNSLLKQSSGTLNNLHRYSSNKLSSYHNNNNNNNIDSNANAKKKVDYRTMIYSTMFPKPHSNNSNNITVMKSNLNKSFECNPNIFNRKKINKDKLNNDNNDNGNDIEFDLDLGGIPNIHSHSPHSDIGDNDSVQSDLVDIDECPIILNTTIKKNEALIKQGKKLRVDYLAKLINSNVWQPTNKLKIHNTLFFYDWDDTLMCTSFITPNGQYTDGVIMSDRDSEKIKLLDSLVASIMHKSTSLGEVYIITNAAPGWVEYSSKKFYPETSKALANVRIISARGLFERKYPGDMKQWKIMAFNEVLKSIDTRLVTNLICLGDSIMEIEAAHLFAANFNHAYIKTVKFKENPMPVDLHKQLSLVVNQLDKIYSCVKNLAIRVEKKKTD